MKNKMTESQMNQLIETAKSSMASGLKIAEALNKIDHIAYNYGCKIDRKKIRAILMAGV